jgi:hypothetical protein
MNVKPPTFEQACRKLPKCLHTCNDSSQTLEDLFFCSLAEIDHHDAGDDDPYIKTKAQRQAAQSYVDWLKPFVDLK